MSPSVLKTMSQLYIMITNPTFLKFQVTKLTIFNFQVIFHLKLNIFHHNCTEFESQKRAPIANKPRQKA